MKVHNAPHALDARVLISQAERVERRKRPRTLKLYKKQLLQITIAKDFLLYGKGGVRGAIVET